MLYEVITNSKNAHISNLKPLPPAHAIVDKCIECGFCEVNCPSKDLTLTPRQRIVITSYSIHYTKLYDAYMLADDATARIMLSTDGGNTYNIELASYSGNLSYNFV